MAEVCAPGQAAGYGEKPEASGGNWAMACQGSPSAAGRDPLFPKRQYASVTGRDPGGSGIAQTPLAV